MTELADYYSFYGRYVPKSERAVPLSRAREIEKLYLEEHAKHRIAAGEIERAHRELDQLGAPRFQKNTQFPLFLSGRINRYRLEKEVLK